MSGGSTLGDPELDGKEASLRGDDANEWACLDRGGGDGLSWARNIRLARTDDGSSKNQLFETNQ